MDPVRDAYRLIVETDRAVAHAYSGGRVIGRRPAAAVYANILEISARINAMLAARSADGDSATELARAFRRSTRVWLMFTPALGNAPVERALDAMYGGV